MPYGTIKEVRLINIMEDQEKVIKLVKKYKILENFDTPNLVFHLKHFEKGEYLTTPVKVMKELLFVIEGTIQIYGIRDEGNITPINHIESPAIIGDLEFSRNITSPFFTEAKTKVTCLALDTEKYKDELNKDVRFLHMLLQSYADKIELFSKYDTVASIEERLLLYMKNIYPDHQLNGIESSLLQLRCSRRQLQRVLKNLCEKNIIKKTGKGKYQLISM